jgi:hypothetical protein
MIGMEVVTVLNDSEQRSWDEIERMWAEDTRGGNGIRALAVGAVGIAIMFAVVGAPWAALAVLVVPVLAWVLSRYWRDLGAACEVALGPVDGRVTEPGEAHRTLEANRG